MDGFVPNGMGSRSKSFPATQHNLPLISSRERKREAGGKSKDRTVDEFG